MLISELLSLNEAAETVTYDINGVKLTAKVVVNRRATKHESGTWDVVLLNKKSGVKITAPEFFSYKSGWSQGTGRSVQGWYLEAHGYGGAGNGSGQSSQVKPSLSWRFERDAIEKMVGKLNKGDKDELRYVDVEDDNNVLELFKKNTVNEAKDDRVALLPATSAVFSKSKVDLNAIGKQWPKGTVYVAERSGGTIEGFAFLYSSGKMAYKIGSTFQAKHDQTSRDLGEFEIVNIITLNGKTENAIDAESENDIATKMKLPLFVFK